MILICGIPSEPPVALAIDAARAARAPHVVFNQREHASCELHVCSGPAGISGTLRIHERDYALESFTGIYTRMVECSSLLGTGTPPGAHEISKSEFLHSSLADWIDVAPCRVVNRIAPSATNGSKPYQASIVASAGFATPDTLITNDSGAVRAFARRHGRIIYKSISGVRSIVREWNPGTGRDLDAIRRLPVQFQEYVEGVDIRVHVIGDELFATRVESAAVDYRYAGRDGMETSLTAMDLEPAIAGRCRDLSRMLNLPFCGIDLRRTAAGIYYCFEANPSPAYSYYEEQSGQPIAAALVRYLSKRAR